VGDLAFWKSSAQKLVKVGQTRFLSPTSRLRPAGHVNAFGTEE
jgi:hypothetical protein